MRRDDLAVDGRLHVSSGVLGRNRDFIFFVRLGNGIGVVAVRDLRHVRKRRIAAGGLCENHVLHLGHRLILTVRVFGHDAYLLPVDGKRRQLLAV